MKIELKISTLKAAAICAPKNDIRYYLNSVCVDIKNVTSVVIVGSDGHCLFIGVESYQGEWGGAAEKIIIPLETIAAALKSFTKGLGYINLERLNTNIMRLGPVIFESIDGHYPDYASAIPNPGKVSPAIGYYNHEQLAKASKAMREASGDLFPTLNQHGKVDAAVMTCNLDNYIAVITPTRVADKNGAIRHYKGIDLPQ